MADSVASRLRRQRARTRLRRQRRAVTDVPLELVIIMIILAIVVPIIIAAFAAYARDQELISLSDQANRVANTAVEVYDDGVNTTLLLTVTIPSSKGANFTIGAPLFPRTCTGPSPTCQPNPQAQYIYYSLSGSGGPSLVQANNGASVIELTTMACHTGNVISYQWDILGGGTHTLSFTKLGPGAYWCNQPITGSFVEVSLQ